MLRIGIIGTGGMANNHAQSFHAIEGVKIAACCDVDKGRVKEYAERHDVPKWYTDYRAMLADETLDGVVNVTPDLVHAEVALAVIARGWAILSEKPMATTLEDARAMQAAAKRAGVITMINFSYRNACALQQAAAVVRAGEIGCLRHVEASYLQCWLVGHGWGDWRIKPALAWRLSTRHGSAGVLGDLGCHLYDAVTLLCGDITEIDCQLRTFDKGLPGNQLGEYHLDANDSFIATVTFANGALGTTHSSRWASGHQNSLRLRAYGDQGAIEVDLDTAYDSYRICRGQEDLDACRWTTVPCPPTPNMQQRFVEAIRSGKPDPSDFANGVKIQAYLHYSTLSSELRQPMAVEY